MAAALDSTPTAAHAANPAAALEAAFREIHATRMHDVPILNAALGVEAVGFAPWEGHWLGILVTPWFMNVMLLPLDAGRWVPLRQGDKRTYAFPSGTFEFIGGHEPAIGPYRSCSLFSPMFEFADHESARLVAEAALAALFDPANAAERDVALPARDESIAQAARRVAREEEAEARGEAPAPPRVTKRDFIRGRRAGGTDRA